MLCSRCQKREAKVYYTEVTDGEKIEQCFLCEECAAQYTSSRIGVLTSNKEFSLRDLLEDMLESSYSKKETEGIEEKNKTELVCELCGMKREEVRKLKKMGCINCYHIFDKECSELVKAIQGSDYHVGNSPKGYVSKVKQIIHNLPEIERLSIQLQQAIEKEKFDDAAKLRDKIKELDEKERSGIHHA